MDDLNDFKSLSLIISWNIWNVKNLVCFEDKFILRIQCAYRSLWVMRSFPQENINIKTRLVKEEDIDRTRPWGYFDGATKREQRSCGAGGILHLSKSHWFSFKAGIGEGTNNFMELSAIRLLI